MEVNGVVHLKVDVEPKECLNVILEELGYHKNDRDFGYAVLDADHEENKVGKKALYKWVDISHHGTPCLDYTLVTDDAIAVEKFEIALRLKELLKY